MNKHVIKVVGTHALINGLLVAGATILVDAYKLAQHSKTSIG